MKRRRQNEQQPTTRPWYRRLALRRGGRFARDDAGYYSAFLHALPRLGELCAADGGRGDWRPCPLSRCERPDHDHAHPDLLHPGQPPVPAVEPPPLGERRRASG